MVVFFSLLFGPSASLLFMCRCGMRWSSPSRKKIPTRKPTAAGRNASFPIEAHCSIAGMSRLHTEAAVIMPAAKPVSAR